MMTEVGVRGKAVGSGVAEFGRQQRNAPVRRKTSLSDYDSMRGEEKGDFQINCYRSMSRSIYGVEQSFEGQTHQKSAVLEENRI